MTLKLLRSVLLLLALATALPAADLYEAVLGPGYVPEIKSKKVPTVTIKRLSLFEQNEISQMIGSDPASLPEVESAQIPKIAYPFEMRRNGQTATVTCIVRVSPEGKVLKTYRLGDDSDLYFAECARSLAEATFPKANRERFYRFVARATLTPVPRKK